MNATLNSDELRAKWESYFSTHAASSFRPEKLGFDSKYNLDQVANDLHKSIWAFQRNYFSTLMKAEWIDRNIVYDGAKVPVNRRPHKGYTLNSAFKQFWLRYLGFHRIFFGNNFSLAIRGYADDLFPNFDEIDALDYDFPYPFEHMKLESLFLVYQLPDRMEFLKEGEKKKMTVTEFEDYLAAWISEMSVVTGRKFQMNSIIRFDGFVKHISEIKSFAEKLKKKYKK